MLTFLASKSNVSLYISQNSLTTRSTDRQEWHWYKNCSRGFFTERQYCQQVLSYWIRNFKDFLFVKNPLKVHRLQKQPFWAFTLYSELPGISNWIQAWIECAIVDHGIVGWLQPTVCSSTGTITYYKYASIYVPTFVPQSVLLWM